MHLLTLHELSLHLNVSVRVLRHRLRQLLQAGKLVENLDCRRDGYVDATHFVWRVDPVAFMRASGIPSASRPDNRATTETLTLATNPGSHQSQPVVCPSSSNSQTSLNVDDPSSSLQREMIDLLKVQLSAKDGQIADLSEQNKKLNDVNLKLVAQTVQQSDRIQTLLRLTEGKMELADTVTKTGNGTANPDSSPGDHVADTDNDFGNQPPSSLRDWGSNLAA